MATMKGKRILTSLYLDPEVAEDLKRLSAETRVPQAVYLREAVEVLLSHYRQTGDLILGKNPPAKIVVPNTLARLLTAADEKTSAQRKPRSKVSARGHK